MRQTRQLILVFGVAGVLLAAPAAFAADSDGDGTDDAADNCLVAANADQVDSDGDGFGDACDGDYNNDGAVDGADHAILVSSFGLAEGDDGYVAAADHDGDGSIQGSDFSAFRGMYGQPLGPSGLVN